jgi:hypothetical protein
MIASLAEALRRAKLIAGVLFGLVAKCMVRHISIKLPHSAATDFLALSLNDAQHD